MINNGKTLNRLWGALVSDFELLMGKYMDSPGLAFEHFAEICKEMQVSLVMNMAIGRGKSKNEHYHCVSSVILHTAKSFWLRPRDQEFGDKSMDRKRRLGGFYLTYIMYMKQPYPGRTKISIDPQDLTFITEFIEDVKVMLCADEIMFALGVLRLNNAFSDVLFSDDFGIEGWRRIALTNQKSETVMKCFEMRDVQDWLAYGTHHHEVDKTLVRFNIVKNRFAEQMKSSILTSHLRHIVDFKETLYGMYARTECLDQFRQGVAVVTDITNVPILTLEQLTATDTIDRRILAETRRRIQRQRKKIMEDPGKASHPYVREGGIYGRKKEVDEEKDNKERRERGMCSGNLWTYINEYTFDKPLGHLPEEKSAAVIEAPGTAEALEAVAAPERAETPEMADDPEPSNAADDSSEILDVD